MEEIENMERLTIRISGYAHGAEGVSADKLTGSYHRGEFEATACVEKLAEYEDLEEQGKIQRLPIAPGDTVYEVQKLRKRIQPYNVIAVIIDRTGYRYYNWELKDGKGVYSNIKGFGEDNFGKTVFLTREEAEAALKGCHNE